MNDPNMRGPTDVEIGLLDAIQTLTEIFLRLGIAPEVIAQPLQFQRDAHREKERTNAAIVLDVLLDFVRDPVRQQQRVALELLNRQPPAGTA